VLHKISWNHKPQSIAEAAQQLELGIDSFVAIDDNPAERALIAHQLPVVGLLDSTDPASWNALEFMLSFPNTRQTAESAARTARYRANANRREAMVGQLDYPAMMASLHLRATWSQARAKHLTRIHELLQRTNQFNTTTQRRTPAELRAALDDPQFSISVCSLGDRFGELGIVGSRCHPLHARGADLRRYRYELPCNGLRARNRAGPGAAGPSPAPRRETVAGIRLILSDQSERTRRVRVTFVNRLV
jgi:FkbH-like protein